MTKFIPHTTVLEKPDNIARKWHLIDAKEKRIGNVAEKAATLLRGKHKKTFTPHVDCGDFVVIINAKEMDITPKKMLQKTYERHSGYKGHLKQETLQTRLEKYPKRVLEDAISGMLPKTRLRRYMLERLKIYTGKEHQHEANKPISVTF